MRWYPKSNRSQGHGPSRCLVALFLALLSIVPSRAFSNVAIGETIENRELPALGGGSRSFLGNADVNVFVFFRPDQEHSRHTMSDFAVLAKEFDAERVQWVAIVSDSYPAADVEAFAEETAIRMPILFDVGDALYGDLGARLTPVVGVTDSEHVLTVYEHFTKINFADRIRARLRHQLGEITDDQLAEVLNPPRAASGGNGTPAKRRLKLARMLFDKGNLEKAKEMALKSIEQDPELAAAHSLHGEVLAAEGDCAAALEAFARALELDPEDAAALAGQEKCGG